MSNPFEPQLNPKVVLNSSMLNIAFASYCMWGASEGAPPGALWDVKDLHFWVMVASFIAIVLNVIQLSLAVSDVRNDSESKRATWGINIVNWLMVGFSLIPVMVIILDAIMDSPLETTKKAWILVVGWLVVFWGMITSNAVDKTV